MRRKKLWGWTVCIALLVICLAGYFLFGKGKNNEKAQMTPTQESASSAAERSDSASGKTEDTTTEEQAESATDTELPEIEIPEESSDTVKPDNERADIHESVSTSQSSAPSVTEPEAGNPPQQEPGTRPAPGNKSAVPSVTEPEAGNSQQKKPGTRPAPGNKSPAPSVTEPEASNPPQKEPEKQPDPDNSDNVVDHNGDILLPEVP